MGSHCLWHVTIAISGSRPYANHAVGFYRESAALLGSEFRLCGHRSAYFTHTYSQGGVASVQLSYAYDLLNK
jgi:hypothetical protein